MDIGVKNLTPQYLYTEMFNKKTLYVGVAY